jgi:hypothetical protein
MYYLLPLILYFMVRFFREYRLNYLLLSMVVFIIYLSGISAYVIVIPFLTVSLIFMVLFIGSLRNWRKFVEVSSLELLSSFLLVILLVVMLGAYYSYISSMMDHAVALTKGRDAAALTAKLESFLYDGPRIGYEKFEALMWPKELTDSLPGFSLDNTLYMGLMTLPFLFYAILAVPFTEKRLLFFSLFSSVVVLGLLSLGDKTFVAEALYNYFPMMKFYRHIGFVTTSYKFLLPLLAGFGLDRFLSGLSTEDKRRPVMALVLAQILLAALLVMECISEVKVTKYLLGGLPENAVIAYFITIIVVLTAVVVVTRRYSPSTQFIVFLITCVFISGISYRGNLVLHVRGKSKLATFSEEAVAVSPYNFQPIRTTLPRSQRPSIAHSYFNRVGAYYLTDYNYLQWDACIPSFRADVLNKHVERLITLRKGFRWVGFMLFSQNLYKDSSFLKVIGCSEPKLRLVRDVVFADDDAKAENLIVKGHDMGDVPVLLGVADATRQAWEGYESERELGEVNITNYSPNRLLFEAIVTETRGAWLYYADAWHPGWKAFVNGEPVPIARANIAFKAIKLPPGKSSINLVFEIPKTRILRYIIIFFCVIFAVTVLAALPSQVFCKHRSGSE